MFAGTTSSCGVASNQIHHYFIILDIAELTTVNLIPFALNKYENCSVVYSYFLEGLCVKHFADKLMA